MKKIVWVIKKLAVWLGYVILAITAVVVVFVISEDAVSYTHLTLPTTPYV